MRNIYDIYLLCFFYRGADKSLARPGRKQAAATKLWFLQATQKQFRMLSVQPGLRGSNDLLVGRKMSNFQLLIQSGRAKDLSAPLYMFRCATHLHEGELTCLLLKSICFYAAFICDSSWFWVGSPWWRCVAHRYVLEGHSKKGKAIPLQALMVPGGRGSQISRQSVHESGKVSPTYRPPLPPRNIPGTHFC